MTNILPPASTPFERAFVQASDVFARLSPFISGFARAKYTDPAPDMLPWLVDEYGLGELTPYVPNIYDLIRDGVSWQRIRGTHASVAKALGWLGYSCWVEEAPARRRWWNRAQLALDRVRDNEDDLDKLEGVSHLSVPARTDIWRGYHGFDIRPQEFSRSRWGRTAYGSSSGVWLEPKPKFPPGIVFLTGSSGATLAAGDGVAIAADTTPEWPGHKPGISVGTRKASPHTKWSFGRRYDIDHALTEAELTALGVWVPPSPDDTPLGWDDFPWTEAPWTATSAGTRSSLMLEAALAGSNTVWVAFFDADGEPIGYRRARACHRVTASVGGPYQMNGLSYALAPVGATQLYVECRTDFTDGYGKAAASIGVMLSGRPISTYPPGALWLPAGAIRAEGPVVATSPVNITFGRTVRERVVALLRF